MKNLELHKYAEILYAKINEAFFLERTEMEIRDWKPDPKRCHDNVTYCCECLSGYKPVRGWFCVALIFSSLDTFRNEYGYFPYYGARYAIFKLWRFQLGKLVFGAGDPSEFFCT